MVLKSVNITKNQEYFVRKYEVHYQKFAMKIIKYKKTKICSIVFNTINCIICTIFMHILIIKAIVNNLILFLISL